MIEQWAVRERERLATFGLLERESNGDTNRALRCEEWHWRRCMVDRTIVDCRAEGSCRCEPVVVPSSCLLALLHCPCSCTVPTNQPANQPTNHSINNRHSMSHVRCLLFVQEREIHPSSIQRG